MIGMSHADRPYLTRPLAGVDQALGDGRARPPVELLDRLRERLDRLDPIHPSASRRPEAAAPGKAPDVGAETESGEDAAEAGEVAESGDDAGSPAGRESRDRLGHDRDLSADQPAAPADGFSPADGPAADGFSSAEGPAADSEFRTVDVVRADKGERYRPWFAADEPATPWFVE